jgi:hypothetical protein
MELDGKLGKLLQKCNATWHDDETDMKRHIKGNFTEDDKKELLKIVDFYSCEYPTPEIVFE